MQPLLEATGSRKTVIQFDADSISKRFYPKTSKRNENRDLFTTKHLGTASGLALS